MAQLLLINKVSKRDVNNLGDIVGIFEDDHMFSPAEIEGFDIVQVSVTADEAKNILQTLLPDTSGLSEDDIPLFFVIPKYSFNIPVASRGGEGGEGDIDLAGTAITNMVLK